MTQELEASYKSTLKKAEEIGFEMLEQGKLAVDAVEAAVQLLEASRRLSLIQCGKRRSFYGERIS
ncbi:isoaspartyl peptidase/L-asparaginase [Vicingaceae bacterium]|nr:isoaspartyl peptidase/L-asparaginase [Vicingaceae bacterium]